MKWWLPILAVGCVTFVGFADEPAAKPKKISLKDENCEIEFPGEPKNQSADKSAQYVLEVREGKAAYMLGVNPLSAKAPLDDKGAVKKLIDAIAAGLTMAESGKVVASTESTLGAKKYPVREVEIELDKSVFYRVRFVLTSDKLYQITALGPKDFVGGAEVKKFFESFKLTDE